METTYAAPVYAKTDVLIVGGTSGAVQAATVLARAGKRVFLVTRFTYLGEDICAFGRYWPTGDLGGPLGELLFADAGARRVPPAPTHLKRSLERTLLEADVPFLYATYPTHMLRDAAGRAAGCIVANRSGFQAIVASVVIDATDRGVVARLAGARTETWLPGRYELQRVVAGAPPAEHTTSRPLPGNARLEAVRECSTPFAVEGEPVTAYECTYSMELDSNEVTALTDTEVVGRLLCFSPDQVFGADRCSCLWPDRLAGAPEAAQSGGASSVPVEALECETESLYLLSDLGRLDESARRCFYEPEIQLPAARNLATRIAESTGEVANIDLEAVHPDYGGVSEVSTGVSVVRRDRYFRTIDRPSIAVDLDRFPVLDRYLVLVAGGGTGGAPAGISAARSGATTLIVEYLSGLGGVGTEGRIGSYYHGNRVGFTAEVDRGTYAMGPDPWFRIEDGEWNTEWKKQWYLTAATAAGARVWFSSISVAAVVRGSTVAGAVVATPFGVGIVRADVTVDATGNSDVAAAAGAETVNISKAHVAVQGTGLSPFTPGTNSENTDHTFVDDTDVYDVTRAFVLAREKFKTAFDLAQLVDSRQRQQVVGELSLDPLDFLAGRTFPDTITTAKSNFDSHGFTIHPLFMAKPPDKEDIRAHVPFRCLIPKGLEGILITGLGVSAHRDALPVIRIQADVQNQGYAAGRAAALSAAGGTPVRKVDIKSLQRHLAEVGVLDSDVPDHTDSFPLGENEVHAAVERGAESYLDLAIVFGHPDKSLPRLRSAYRSATSLEQRTHFARILGLLGDDTGIDALVEALDGTDWDEGWRFVGMGQFGFSLSHVDTLLVAAARSRNSRALPQMIAKLKRLDGTSEFSHMRAVTLAFEAQPTPEAAPEFARLLVDSRIRGADRVRATEAIEEVNEDRNDTSERNRQLTELLLARGLYACGDKDGLAKSVLEAYAADFHGHYARHARAVLGVYDT